MKEIMFLLIVFNLKINSQNISSSDTLIDFSYFNSDSPYIGFLKKYNSKVYYTKNSCSNVITLKVGNHYIDEILKQIDKMNFSYLQNLMNTLELNENSTPIPKDDLKSLRNLDLSLDDYLNKKTENTFGEIDLVIHNKKTPYRVKNSILITTKQRNITLRIIISIPEKMLVLCDK